VLPGLNVTFGFDRSALTAHLFELGLPQMSRNGAAGFVLSATLAQRAALAGLSRTPVNEGLQAFMERFRLECIAGRANIVITDRIIDELLF